MTTESLVAILKRANLPGPIFVLAPPGMYGETVAAMLGQHPQCWGLPEINLELSGNLDALIRDMTGMRSAQLHGLLRSLSQLLTGEQTIIGVEAARRRLSRHAYLPTSAVWQLLAQRIAPKRIVAPVTSAIFEGSSLSRLVDSFPAARFVALKMHPKSHGESVMAQHGGAAAWLLGAVDETVAPVMPEPSEIWQLAKTALADLVELVDPKQFIALRIEDLAHANAPTLRDLTAQLGLSFTDDDLAAMQKPQASVFLGRGPFGAHFGGEILSLQALAKAIAPLDTLTLEGWAPWRTDGMPLDKSLRQQASAQGYR